MVKSAGRVAARFALSALGLQNKPQRMSLIIVGLTGMMLMMTTL